MEIHRLKAVTEIDVRALTQILEVFETRSVVPYRIFAERATVFGTSQQVLKIAIDVAATELGASALQFVAAKISQLPIVLTAVVGDGAP